MSDEAESEDTDFPRLDKLWRARCACRVLSESIEAIAEGEYDVSGRFDRLYGVAFLVDLVGESFGEEPERKMSERPS